jgi:hypothetical protein
MKFYPQSILIYLFCLLVLGKGQLFAQQEGVSINNSGALPDSSAILDVSSTQKGMLIPRMTEAQRNAIPNPALGLLIFNTTTSCINMWDGASWKESCFDCAFQAPMPNSNGPVCAGDTLQLSAGSLAGATYSWTGPNGFSSSQQNPFIPNATTAASGIYTLVVTVSGCSSQPMQVQATVSAYPVAPTASNNGPACAGGNLQLSATTLAGAAYSWTGPGGFSSSNQNPLISGFSLSDTGYYYVSASVNGCSSGIDSTLVQGQAAPTAPGSISGNSNACNNATGEVYSIASVPGATSYTWTVPAGATIVNGQGTNSITVNWGTSSGNVCVTSNSSCGSSSSSCLSVNLSSVGGTGSQTFNHTGAEQIFVVPPCVSSVSFQVYGAQGGANGTAQGGQGGYSTGSLAVNGGDTLYVYVGGEGIGNLLCNGTAGGFNGGGSVALVCCSPSGARGGSGGGASDVRYGGNTLNDRVIVAGGGGGASNSYAGAIGGGLTGGDGLTYLGLTTTGGTQVAGGNAGGNYSGCTNGPATPGTFGQGGRGDANDGGGGGGGWYGGGGGGNNGPGGGGSGYIGGVTGGTTTQGGRTGHGLITITW